jgi:ParB-like chromosome segregation protein Spo0J
MAERMPLKDIIVDLEVQARERLDDERVALFAENYAENALGSDLALPPIILVKTPEGELILADGFTRFNAARRAGVDSIDANIVPGTKRDAILTNIVANTTHGAPLTLAERRHAIQRLLGDAEWRKESDRSLGHRCGLDHKTVGKLRAELAPTTVHESRTARRKGKTYKVKTRSNRKAEQSGDQVETLSGEIPQITPSDQTNAHSKGRSGPSRNKRSLEQLGALERQWAVVSTELSRLLDMLDTADRLVHERFLKDRQVTTELLRIFRSSKPEQSRNPAEAGSPT